MAAQAPTMEMRHVQEARAERILKEIETERFAKRTPIIHVFCADFRRNFEATRHTALMRGFGPDEDWQVHAFRWHGGALRLAPDSPTNEGFPDASDVFLNEILEAIDIAGIRDVHLYGHFPCGKAAKHNLPFSRIIADLVMAKFRLRQAEPRFKVSTFLHIDYGAVGGSEKMRSYYVCPDSWGMLVQERMKM